MNTARQIPVSTPATVSHEKAIGVYKAINAVQADLASVGIGKNQQNTHQRYNFRGIDDVYNALAPSLAKNNLVIVPKMLSRDVTERPGRNNTVQSHVVVQVQYDFISAVDGSTHSVVMFGEAIDSSDKATNKAFTAAYKYACFQVFCIPTESNTHNDADYSTPETQYQKPQNQHQPNNQQPRQDYLDAAAVAVERHKQRQQQQNQSHQQPAQQVQAHYHEESRAWNTSSESGPTAEQLRDVQQLQQQQQQQQQQHDPVINPQQYQNIKQAMKVLDMTDEKFCRAAKIDHIGALQANRFDKSMNWLNHKIDHEINQ